MKNKILLTLSFGLALSLGTQAQWNVGNTVPQLDDQDPRTGEMVSLYGDFLDKNMAVFIDASAVWCGPCVQYHQTRSMEDMWNQYGPDGTGELGVIWVDAEGNNNLAALQGSNSQGYDWTQHAPHPMMSINIPVDAYPTMYLICPSGEVVRRQNWWASANDAITLARSSCGTLGGPSADVDAGVEASEVDGSNFCGDFSPEAVLKNNGTGNLMAAEITLKINGQVQETKNWSGSLAPGAETTVSFASIAGLDGQLNVEYAVSISGDEIADNNKSTVTLDKAPMVQGNGSSVGVTIDVKPDAWGSEVTWTVQSPGGSTVLSGGPYEDYATQSGGNWVADTTSITVDSQDMTVQENQAGCYTFTINDTGNGGDGDGIFSPNNTSWGYGYVELKDENGNVLEHKPGNFYTKTGEMVFEVSFGVGVEEVENTLGLNVFPQPAQNELNVTLKKLPQDAVLNIYNTLGELVYTQGVNRMNTTLDVTNFAGGSYVLNIASSKVNTSQSFLLVK